MHIELLTSSKWDSECRYGTVMGGLLSNKWLDVNVNVPFMGPKLDTPSLGKYKQVTAVPCLPLEMSIP